ncbi:MAG: hypothetical protein OEW15_13985 [Nitrospirota bacterium]|nr:hypothetical protein [Nitrospirota bacterium]
MTWIGSRSWTKYLSANLLSLIARIDGAMEHLVFPPSSGTWGSDGEEIISLSIKKTCASLRMNRIDACHSSALPAHPFTPQRYISLYSYNKKTASGMVINPCLSA